MKAKLVDAILLGIFVLGVWYRIGYFGDLRLSIATNDTYSYIDSSRPPLFSWESFAGRRLFTTNLVYKLANDEERCNILVISQPAAGTEGDRAIQPCFDNIALLQNLLSIGGWCLLAWVTAQWLRNPVMKISSAIILLGFGFAPQLAEWDSVLGAESLSLSLFALMFAVLQELVFRLASDQEKQFRFINRFLIPLWFIVFSLWVFVRDVHLYAVIVTLALAAPFLFSGKIRKLTLLLPAIVCLILLLFLGNYTARESTRWQTSLHNNLDGFVFPFAARVDYFTKFGLPNGRSGEIYDTWLDTHGLEAYGKFLATHPGFVLTTLWERSDYFRTDSFQPYFRKTYSKYPDTVRPIGEMIHPETNAIYLIDLLILISLCITAIQQREKFATARAWLALWLFGYAGLSLVLSFFGDTNGVHRHIFPSMELFRLFLWIFLFQILDTQRENPALALADSGWRG